MDYWTSSRKQITVVCSLDLFVVEHTVDSSEDWAETMMKKQKTRRQEVDVSQEEDDEVEIWRR